MKGKISVLSLFALSFLAGCNNEEVSFNTQEDSRRQASENAEYNARKWRNKNADDYKILMRGDSTISSTCAQGDGWASIDLKNKEGGKIELKCSTVSGTIGCLEKKAFQEREYAQQEGHCNKEIPYPLPKIEK